MKIVRDKISVSELDGMAKMMFGNMVKAVVDVKKDIAAVDAELHADMEAYLIENGSDQCDLWGINLYPGQKKEDFIEYDSMINIRPNRGNRSRGVEDKEIRAKITEIINKLVKK
ncbi:MAG: DUF5674 family protein [Candidatus Saganbacteria bacterium]|nr:DUF5674 family protein [Candidatus Saganbacteria bacterium]